MKKGVHVPTYRSWQMMKNRCGNPRSDDFAYYGAKGIFYPHAWTTYEGFVADMGLRPDGLTLERRDGEASYSVTNCCWATRLQQARNRAYTRDLTFNHRTMKVWEWAAELRVTPMVMHHRLWRFDIGRIPIEKVYELNTRKRRNGLV